LDEVVDPAEEITRFLRSTSHLRRGIGRPHFAAFMPRLQDGDISVYRTLGMAKADIIDLGARFVGRPDLPLKGHCSLAAQDLFVEGLDVVPAPDPHERHANVCGWTADPKNRIIAKKLADKASLVAYEDG
jgi:hypothetical protein